MQTRPRKKKIKRFLRCQKCGKQVRIHQRRCKTCHLQLKTS